MGTRNLTSVRVGDAIKVAQYCQWDGYPKGQGETISVFLRKADMAKFRDKVNELEFVTDAELSKLWKEAGAKEGEVFVTTDISDKFLELYPEFHRDTGAEILQLIYDGKVKKIENDFKFLEDTVFCEYAYILDLDKELVEVYTGRMIPTRIIPFADFMKEGAMEKLQAELNEA